VSRAVGSPAERRAAPSQDAAQRLRQQSRGEQRGGYRSKRDKGNTGGKHTAVLPGRNSRVIMDHRGTAPGLDVTESFLYLSRQGSSR